MKRLKAIAMYLPQFHRLPENDRWWGEGFTEWTAVRAAEKLFEGHNQVREPLEDNYYDLLQKDTMRWQAELAEKYGIDGFCFYHYYFKDGRRIMEKPAENLLGWKDIAMPFCFCWANETWARTWSNISSANTWSEKFENAGETGSNILLEQNYGDRAQWEAHFEYLWPFFADERYIRVEGKPVFLFYKPEDISVLQEMLSCWNGMAEERGCPGIYAIGVNAPGRSEGLDAILYQGPNAYRLPHIAGKKARESWAEGIKTCSYENLWENARAVPPVEGRKTYFGGFVDYDDTPRRGRLGMCLLGVSAESFERNLYSLAVKNIAQGNELYFINAWNEWGEGNYLEPDKKNGYGFLSAVKRVMDRCNAEDFDGAAVWRGLRGDCGNEEEDEKGELLRELNKFKLYYRLLDRWLFLKEQGKSTAGFFAEKGYRRVAVYGMAALGRHLYEELQDSPVEVVYAIDRRQGLQYKELKIQSPQEPLKACDVIVVTAFAEMEEIAAELRSRTDIPVVSLQDVIFG